MQINGPPSPPPSPSRSGGVEADTSPATRQWQAGDKLLATVLRLVSQGAILAVGRTQILARSLAPLQVGQNLKLEVLQPRSDPPVLRILNASRTPNPAEQALRTLLPRQTSLAPLLANLGQLARAGATATPAASTTAGTAAAPNSALPRPVTEQLQQLLRLLPDVAQASRPDGLKQALQDSGLFLEARLARLLTANTGASPAALQRQAAHLFGGDLRAGLLRLATALQASQPQTPPGSAQAGARTGTATPAPVRGMPPQPQAQASANLAGLSPAAAGRELLQQVEGALARIQLHQLQSLSQSQSPSQSPSPTQSAPLQAPLQLASGNEANRAVWALELPLRNGQEQDLFGLHIQRDGGKGTAGTHPEVWSVTLAFDLAGLGPVRTQISLYEGQISAQFWAEQAETRARFQTHLDQLQARLSAVGLHVGRLGCQCGIPPDATPPPPSGRVNEKA